MKYCKERASIEGILVGISRQTIIPSIPFRICRFWTYLWIEKSDGKRIICFVKCNERDLISYYLIPHRALVKIRGLKVSKRLRFDSIKSLEIIAPVS